MSSSPEIPHEIPDDLHARTGNPGGALCLRSEIAGAFAPVQPRRSRLGCSVALAISLAPAGTPLVCRRARQQLAGSPAIPHIATFSRCSGEPCHMRVGFLRARSLRRHDEILKRIAASGSVSVANSPSSFRRLARNHPPRPEAARRSRPTRHRSRRGVAPRGEGAGDRAFAPAKMRRAKAMIGAPRQNWSRTAWSSSSIQARPRWRLSSSFRRPARPDDLHQRAGAGASLVPDARHPRPSAGRRDRSARGGDDAASIRSKRCGAFASTSPSSVAAGFRQMGMSPTTRARARNCAPHDRLGEQRLVPARQDQVRQADADPHCPISEDAGLITDAAPPPPMASTSPAGTCRCVARYYVAFCVYC